MAVQAQFRVDGFDELFANMAELKEEIGKGKTDKMWREALTVSAQPILDAAKRDAPRDSGQLADHIYMKVQRPMARDKAGKYYAGEMYMARITVSPIRDDTELHFILNKRGKTQPVYKKKRPVAISQEFGNAHNGAHPFLRPALESNVDLVVAILGDRIKLILDKFAKTQKSQG
jgi:hypothetical protein